MRNVVRAIIVEDNSILLLKRIKNGDVYWVFPGGGVEVGESRRIALVRECKEELGLDVKVTDLMFKDLFVNKKFGLQKEYFYSCKILGGQLGMGNGPEYSQNSYYIGTYEPCRVELEKVPNLDLRPVEIKNNLLKKIYEYQAKVN